MKETLGVYVFKRYAGYTMQNLAEKGSCNWNKAYIHNIQNDIQHYLWVELAHNGVQLLIFDWFKLLLAV